MTTSAPELELPDLTATVEHLVVEVDGRQGLAHLERVVGLLRGRRHPVAGLSCDLDGDLARIVVWGEDLHGGHDDALVVRRLERLPGVLAVRVETGTALRRDASDGRPARTDVAGDVRADEDVMSPGS